MNSYARRALRYWQNNLPRQYAQISNPEKFFATMGETMAEQINTLATQMEGPDDPNETFLDKLGRLNRVRTEAEHTVMGEMLPEPETSDPVAVASN